MKQQGISPHVSMLASAKPALLFPVRLDLCAFECGSECTASKVLADDEQRCGSSSTPPTGPVLKYKTLAERGRHRELPVDVGFAVGARLALSFRVLGCVHERDTGDSSPQKHGLPPPWPQAQAERAATDTSAARITTAANFIEAESKAAVEVVRRLVIALAAFCDKLHQKRIFFKLL